jgi:hypothetical protein
MTLLNSRSVVMETRPKREPSTGEKESINRFESSEKNNPVEVPAFCSFKPSSLKNVVSMIF